MGVHHANHRPFGMVNLDHCPDDGDAEAQIPSHDSCHDLDGEATKHVASQTSEWTGDHLPEPAVTYPKRRTKPEPVRYWLDDITRGSTGRGDCSKNVEGMEAIWEPDQAMLGTSARASSHWSNAGNLQSFKNAQQFEHTKTSREQSDSVPNARNFVPATRDPKSKWR
ncbi:hypothetical protein VDGL01_04907 [Verticillium dahliae]